MKLFLCYFAIASATYAADAVDAFKDDLHMFLPFLQNRAHPSPCPRNEVYKSCSRNCSDCDQRGKCAATNCIKQCDCAPRFFRVTPNGPCEPVANCPKRECEENEVFRECGPICERCTTYRCHAISCDHKCYCKAGYLRNRDGTCIPEEECPKRTRCGKTEEWSESGPVDEFCLSSENGDFRNETQEVAQCYCKEGHRRNILGYCINETLCPLIHCVGKEVYHDCVPRCNTTCRNYGDPKCIDDDNCYQGCFCPPGSVMNDFRTCIPVKDCSPDMMHILEIEQDETTDEVDAADDESLTTSKYGINTDATNTSESIRDEEIGGDYTITSQMESNSETPECREMETTLTNPSSKALTTLSTLTSSLSTTSTLTTSSTSEPTTDDSNSESSDEESVVEADDATESCRQSNEYDIDNEEI